jgi:hypothetical protein
MQPTPSIYSAATGHGEEEPEAPRLNSDVEERRGSPRELERKKKHFDFLKVRVARQRMVHRIKNCDCLVQSA